MHRPIPRSALLGGLALIIGCASAPPEDAVAEYRGRYTSGFEDSRFIACDVPAADRPWWVVLSDDALRQRDSLRALLPQPVRPELFVRWRGIPGRSESAGHMGRSTRYFRVVEILELRAVHPADCGGRIGLSRD